MVKLLILLVALVPAIAAVPTDEQCSQVVGDRIDCAKKNVKSLFVKTLGMNEDFELREAIKVGYQCLKDNGCRVPSFIKVPDVEKQLHEQTADFANQALAHHSRVWDYLENDLGWTEENPFKDNDELKTCVEQEGKKTYQEVLDSCVPENLKDLLKTGRRGHRRGGRKHGGRGRHGGHHGGRGQVMKILSMAEKFTEALGRICEEDKVPDVFVCVKAETGVDVSQVVRKREEIRKAACELNDQCKAEVEAKHGAGIEKECMDSKHEKVRQIAVDKCKCVKENVLPTVEKCAAKIPNFEMPALASKSCEDFEQEVVKMAEKAKAKRFDVCGEEFDWDAWKDHFHPKKN